MIELSMGSFLAAMIAGILGFGGVVGSAGGTAKFSFFALLVLSLALVITAVAQRWQLRRSSARDASAAPRASN